MKLTLSDARLLKESVNVISELVNEVTFKVGKSGMELLAIDPANVAMIDFRLSPDAFAEYNVDADTSLSVNLESLRAILRRAKPEDSIILSLDESKSRMKIELAGDGKRTFNIALIDIDREQQKLPNLKFNAKVVVPAAKLDDAITDMGIVSDSVALTAEASRFAMKAEGSLSDAKSEFHASESVSIALGKEEEVTAKYAVEYLAKMAKAAKLADEVSLSFSSDYPLKLEYTLQNKLRLGFILAPRVSND